MNGYSSGFNPSTMKYKVFDISSKTRYIMQLNPNNGLSTREVSQRFVEFKIFTLGCGSDAGSWRKIDHSYPCDRQLYVLASERVCTDGVVHWRHRLFHHEIFSFIRRSTIEAPSPARSLRISSHETNQRMSSINGSLISGGIKLICGYQNRIDVTRFAWKERSCLWPVDNFRTGLI